MVVVVDEVVLGAVTVVVLVLEVLVGVKLVLGMVVSVADVDVVVEAAVEVASDIYPLRCFSSRCFLFYV